MTDLSWFWPVQLRMRRSDLWIAASAAALLLPACGGSADFNAWGTGSAGAASRAVAAPSGGGAQYQVSVASAASTFGGEETGYQFDTTDSTGDRQPNAPAPAQNAPARYAQAAPPAAEQVPASLAPPPPEPVADDAHHGPLLIYIADLRLAVHQVSEKQGIIEALATAAGGHLDQRTQNHIRIRVPADRFDEVLAQILELGDVLSRDVSVQDVSEQFHDMALRIRTLEAMYARVQQLLARAEDVEQALAVEQHLQRITVELEHLRGRLRFLADRIAFSTITVQFQEQATVTEPTFSLPFQWLRSLGLQDLMRLQ